MGYICHHTIIVVGMDFDFMDKFPVTDAHKKAVEIFGDTVSLVVSSPMNGYMSFFVAPDGSKEGWDDSNEGDSKRDEFKEFLRGMESQPAWIETTVGDEAGGDNIVDQRCDEE